MSVNPIAKQYELLHSKQAAKYIRKQDKPTRKRINKTLLTLAENPFHKGGLDISSLKGVDSAFRLWIGDFRVVYEVI